MYSTCWGCGSLITRHVQLQNSAISAQLPSLFKQFCRFGFFKLVVKLVSRQFAKGNLEKAVLAQLNSDISSLRIFPHSFGLLYSPCSETAHLPFLVLA